MKFTRVPTWFCSLDRRDAAAQEEKVCVLEFVWSESTRVGWEDNIDFSFVLADVGSAMEKARKAHRPNIPANALRLYDMFTVAMTQQALLLDQTSECSCASATSCCVYGHADDEASIVCLAANVFDIAGV